MSYIEKLREAGLGFCDYKYSNEDLKSLIEVVGSTLRGVVKDFNGRIMLNGVVVKNNNDVLFRMSDKVDLSDYLGNKALVAVPEDECFCISYNRLCQFLPYLLQYDDYTVDNYNRDKKILESMDIDGYFWFASKNFLMEKIIGKVRTTDVRFYYDMGYLA